MRLCEKIKNLKNGRDERKSKCPILKMMTREIYLVYSYYHNKLELVQKEGVMCWKVTNTVDLMNNVYNTIHLHNFHLLIERIMRLEENIQPTSPQQSQYARQFYEVIL